MILKQTIYNILLNQPETRDSDKKLIWIVLDKLGFITYTTDDMKGELKYEHLIEAPTFEGIRRCRQALQRSDLLTGKKLIQPSKVIKEKRVKLSKEKGYSFIQGKEWVFNPVTETYEQQ